MDSILNLEQLKKIKSDNSINLFYVSSETCNVCKVLKPKIIEIVSNYPKIKSWYVDRDELPEVASELSVFTIPIIIVFIDGREYIRESRYVSLSDLEEKISKYYSMYIESIHGNENNM